MNPLTFSSPPRRSALALLLALAGSGFCPRSAQALVLQAKACETKAHAAGWELKGVAGLFISLPAATGAAAGPISFQSATYIGLDASGRHGLLLTAAHGFMDPTGRLLRPDQVEIAFGPQLDAEHKTLRMAATRVIVHPEAGYRTGQQELEGTATGTYRFLHCDLALVEFDAAWGERLAELKIPPMPLYEGKAFTKPLLEAKIAGFGLLGRAGEALPTKHTFRIHAGHTRVSHQDHHGEVGFHALTPVSMASGEWQETDRYRFAEVPEPITLLQQHSLRRLPIQTHRLQVGFALGDSGGPLLFNTKGNVLKLAGVNTGDHLLWAIAPGTLQEIPVRHEYFTAVPDHLDWIHAVQAGEVGKSRVLVPRLAAKDAGGGAKPAAATETKADGAAGNSRVADAGC